MKKRWWNFSREQWIFLSVMQVMNEGVSIDIIGELVPLSPAQLFDLLNRSMENGIIRKLGKDGFVIINPLPPAVSKKLEEINTPARISSLLDRLIATDSIKKVPSSVVDKLRQFTSREYEIVLRERELALAAIQEGRLKWALKRLEKVLAHG